MLPVTIPAPLLRQTIPDPVAGIPQLPDALPMAPNFGQSWIARRNVILAGVFDGMTLYPYSLSVTHLLCQAPPPIQILNFILVGLVYDICGSVCPMVVQVVNPDIFDHT